MSRKRAMARKMAALLARPERELTGPSKEWQRRMRDKVAMLRRVAQIEAQRKNESEMREKREKREKGAGDGEESGGASA